MSSTITLTATLRGTLGNSYTLTDTSTALTVTPFGGGADADSTSYDSGLSTFDIAADKWDRTSALTALHHVTDSERGLFWQARDGTLTWKNRDFPFRQVASAVALTLNGEQIDHDGGQEVDDIANVVMVEFTPRSSLIAGVVAAARNVITVPGQSGAERWNGTVVLPGGGSVVVRLPFTDPTTGQPMGARSLVTPLEPFTDYTAGDGPDNTAYTTYYPPTFSLAISGSNVEISIHNAALGPLYVNKLQVRGVGLVSYNPTQVIREDTASQDAYGRRVLTVRLPLPGSQAFAESLADYLLNRLKDTAYRVTTLSFGYLTQIDSVDLFSLEIGTVISLSDPNTGIASQRYLITGVKYRLEPGGVGTAQFHVLRLDDSTYGLYDDPIYGKLDSTFRYAL